MKLPVAFQKRALSIFIATTLIVAPAVASHVYLQRQKLAQLIEADPDAIAQDPRLTTFAVETATPVYQANCAQCHGADMHGNPAKAVPDLTDDDWLYGEGRIADIERTILYGIRAGNNKSRNLADMPAFARSVPYQRYDIAPLQPGEIMDVVEYLQLEAGKSADIPAARRGASIFSGKGQCFDCHAPDAKGDSSIGAPNLVDNIWLRGDGSRADIADTISYGLSGICPAWGQRVGPVIVRALATLIYTASHHPAKPRPAS
jgi:cytochrome c oxidase cbb3-type subunit 3